MGLQYEMTGTIYHLGNKLIDGFESLLYLFSNVLFSFQCFVFKIDQDFKMFLGKKNRVYF